MRMPSVRDAGQSQPRCVGLAHIGIAILLVLIVMRPMAKAQQTPSAGVIQGIVKSGDTPIPGATVTATQTLTGQKVVTWTGVNGQYAVILPTQGRYVVKVQM